MDGNVGREVQQVGLYLLYQKAPFVKPLTSQVVHADTTEVRLPSTGKEFSIAVRETCLIDLGLYTQRA